MGHLIFVDCEATGPCIGNGVLTEFGAVEYPGRETFHGVLHESRPSDENPALSTVTGREFDAVAVYGAFAEWLRRVADGRQPTFVSDNPAFDWQWINHGFWHALGRNPFGHSARRIGDFAAGLSADFRDAQSWKSLRQTVHDHHPVNDAMGNVEAFTVLMERAEQLRSTPHQIRG